MTNRTTTDRVVCALDDSTHAADVLDTAAALAGRLDLWLTLIHSPTPDVFTVGERRREIIERGHEFVARISAGHEINEVIVQPGDPAHLLMSHLHDGAGLAVVGSRGRGPTRAALLGSVSGGLIRSSPCPVVVVPPNASLSTLSAQPRILCGLDGSAEAAHAMEWASGVAWTTGGRLLVAHVRSEPHSGTIERSAAALAQAEQGVARVSRLIQASIHGATGDPAHCLDELARSHKADLIVVGSHGQRALRAALGGSVSARLAASAGTPVVAVPLGSRLDARWAPGMHAAA